MLVLTYVVVVVDESSWTEKRRAAPQSHEKGRLSQFVCSRKNRIADITSFVASGRSRYNSRPAHLFLFRPGSKERRRLSCKKILGDRPAFLLMYDPKGRQTVSRKALPHSRSFSLQMLTHTPNAAPVEERMYSEALQPLRSPPEYPSTESLALAPPLARLRSTLSGASSQSNLASPEYSVLPQRTAPSSSTRPFHGDAAVLPTSNSYRSERPDRAVSMPAKPSTTSEYDSMFTFTSELPEDLAQTLNLPSMTPSPMDSPYSTRPASVNRSYSPNLFSPQSTRVAYIQNGRSVSTPQPVAPSYYSTHDEPASSSPSGSRAEPRPLAAGMRRPSVLHSLGSWLDKRQDATRTNQSAR